MKVEDFKKAIKQAVKEAIQEELKEILLEAVKAPKAPVAYSAPITETVMHTEPVSQIDARAKYADLIGDMKRGQTEFSFNSSHAANFNASQPYQPRTANTAGEGSSLPPGEVSLNQIMGLMHK